MAESLSCWRCGHSLEDLSLPLSRRDQCPECAIDLHVCRMCTQFDSEVPRACREDDAEEIKEKVMVAGGFRPPADEAPMIDDASELDAKVGEEVANS